MEKSKDKRLEQKERNEAETARSLSVVEMKEAHKQIEEIDKARKKPSILSIIERLENNEESTLNMIKTLQDTHKRYPEEYLLVKPHPLSDSHFNSLFQIYESIRFDLQKTIDMKSEDFERIFPKLKFSTESFIIVANHLAFMIRQMKDMKAYCKRLL